MAQIQDRLHSIKSASKFLGGISAHTIRGWLRQGRLSRVKVGRRTMLSERELRRFIAICNRPISQSGTAVR
jgi:hypothetical protein